MELILQLLRKQTRCTCATLHVKSTNAAAVRFYERLGFTCDPETGFLENHYYIDGKHYDAQYFQQDLRPGILGVIKAYCSLL